jgi:hypothetical protein
MQSLTDLYLNIPEKDGLESENNNESKLMT